MLTSEIASNLDVSSLWTQHKFTDCDKIWNLYSAISDLTARCKHKIVFDSSNTDTTFRTNPNHGIHVITITPKRAPNSDNVNNMLTYLV